MRMRMMKGILKELLGARYEQALRGLLVSGILFFSFYSSGLRLEISPRVLFLTATFFSAGIMGQALSSKRNAEVFQGLFVLPLDPLVLSLGYALSFAFYVVVTKALPVLALLYALGGFEVGKAVMALFWSLGGCLFVASCFVLGKKIRWGFLLLWGAALAAIILWGRAGWMWGLALLLSLGLSLFLLSRPDAYAFYPGSQSALIIRQSRHRGSVFFYFLRYLTARPVYLTNTLVLGALGCFLPFFQGQVADMGLPVLPLGLAILCLNTPLCTLLSADPGTRDSLRTFPGQVRAFCLPYAIFLFLVNLLVQGIYLFSWHLTRGGVRSWELLLGPLFSLQSAILSVGLEWVWPLRNWKAETDLWHHPRKYLVPGIMMLLAAALMAWPGGVWVFLGLLMLETLILMIWLFGWNP